jgi:hypothetical protein
MDQLLEIIEQNPGYKLLGKEKLKKLTGISSKVINTWWGQKEINQIYAKPKKYQGIK